jgi:hypothetical protein
MDFVRHVLPVAKMSVEHLAVVPWLAARLAEVEAQDRDDTDLEDWLRALLDALADASQRRRPR